MISEISSLNLDLGSLGIYLLIVMICPHKTVVFIWGKIFPQGVILWFTQFGEWFQFPGCDFTKLEYTEILNDSKTKNYICHFGTKWFDALQTEHGS